MEVVNQITIIGAGPATLSFVEKFREINKESKITLIDKSQFSFKKRNIIYDPIKTNIKINLEEWAKTRNCEFICSQVEKVSPKRKRINLKEAQALNYENLIVATGLVSKKLEIKGEHREGFFYLSDLEPESFKNILKISNEAIVYVSTWLGIVLTMSLLSLGKEVKIIADNLDFLGDYKERVIELLKRKNIDIYLDATIDEAVGESIVRAVKISPLKVFSAQMLFIDSGFTRELKLFNEDFQSSHTFLTNYPDVYLLGDITRNNIENRPFFNFDYIEIESQANVLIDYLLNKKDIEFSEKILASQDQEDIIEGFLGVYREDGEFNKEVVDNININTNGG